VEDCLELCVSQVARQGLFRSSLSRRACLSAGPGHPADISDPFEVKVELGRFVPRLQLTYEIRQNGKSFSQRQDIGLVQTWPSFGGWRWWFFWPWVWPPSREALSASGCHEIRLPVLPWGSLPHPAPKRSPQGPDCG
jgi:hypothetical protein